MQIYFVSFADSKYAKTLARIRTEAIAMGVFDDIFCLSEAGLDDEFRAKHQEFIQANPRGYGYWIWKGQVIKQALRQIPAGAILFYTDAGCSLNQKGIPRLLEYCEMIEASPAHRLVFQLGEQFRERFWTKKYCLDFMGALKPEVMNSPQIIGGIFGIKKGIRSQSFVDAYAANLLNYDLVSDEAIVPNEPDFREHRHDQSVWSIMNKLADPTPVILPDETYFPDNWDNGYPFHARRLRF